MAEGQQDAFARTALAVALQHPAVAADQRIICSLLQVSKAWRAAVQGSAAGLTRVIIAKPREEATLIRLGGMASWLAAFPQLINSIDITPPDSYYVLQHSLDLDTARRLLDMGIQLAAAGRGMTAMDATLPVAVHQPSWRLQSFSCNLYASSAMIAALPAATLTRLLISADPIESQVVAVPERLLQLRNLQHLSIGPRLRLWSSIACSLSTLQQLRTLEIRAECKVSVLEAMCQMLPRQLQALSILGKASDPEPESAPQVVSFELRYLTALERLRLVVGNFVCLANTSALPSQLQCLTIIICGQQHPIELLGLTGLQDLRQLSLEHSQHTHQELQQLTLLAQLSCLSLECNDVEHARECGPTWGKLMSLKGLELRLALDPDSVSEVLRFVMETKSLTKLDLELEVDTDGIYQTIPVCSYLEGLHALLDLEIYMTNECVQLLHQDALHLTGLVHLTKLCIRADGAIDGVCLCELALCLTRLQHLHVESCPLSASALPAVGRLSSLKSLFLQSLSRTDQQQGLQFLSGLTELTRLGGFSACEDQMAGFWSRIRQLRLAGA